MTLWTTVLAAMLHLQSPGKTIYSRVEVGDDSPVAAVAEVNGVQAFQLFSADDEDLPLQCQQPGNVACSRPKLRDVTYNGHILRRAWVRSETYDEGVERYAVIARAIEAELGSDRSAAADSRMPDDRAWRYLVAIAYHESGFRRDIHSGRGSAALGDCRWTGKSGARKRVKGSCRSHGLFQTMFTSQRGRIMGMSGRDIVGLSPERTRRQARIAISHLDRLHTYCQRTGPRPYLGCVFASYGGMAATRDPRIVARVATYNKVSSAPKLDRYVSDLLGVSVGDKVAAAD